MNSSPLNRFKILVLSKEMLGYRAAYYQQDFLRELSNQAECYFYGPGFPDYSPGQSLSQVLEQSNFGPDFILTAHSFLEDNEQRPLESIPGLRLESSSIPIFSILNKEYSRLDEKTAFFSAIPARALYTHHHNLKDLIGEIELPHFFFPFGVDPVRFSFSEKKRKYDVGFTGLLKNPTVPGSQADTRIELMREIYHSVLRTPIWRRAEYAHLRIFWKSWTGSPVSDLLGRALGFGKLSEGDYVRALASTKVWINAPSPLGIVSTRFFECMASGAVVVAQDLPGLDKLFPKDLLATFSHVSEFPTLLERMLADDVKLTELAREARQFVLLNHSWKVRVAYLLDTIADSLSR